MRRASRRSRVGSHFGDRSRSTVQRQLSRSEAVPDVPIVPAVPPLATFKTLNSDQARSTVQRFKSFNIFEIAAVQWSSSSPLGFIKVLAPIRRMNWRQNSQRIDKQQCHSRFFSNDFAVLPNIDRRPVHACGLAGDLCGAAQGAPNGRGELLGFLLHFSFFHGPCSNNIGLRPELSYTLHLSAKRR